MQISVVIPTCNRKARLLSLLQNLDQSAYAITEVIIIDAGNDKLLPGDYGVFRSLNIRYTESEKSVCIQRNTGIRMAKGAWILLCDDDIEIPRDYLQVLTQHIRSHPEAGAVSGRWMEKEKGEWKATHPIDSARELSWRYIFQLSIWGEIYCKGGGLTGMIKRYYERKGNHISQAGWPVNTVFSGEYVICPVYSLGASLVKKEWLLNSPFDETLDRHGIGDNYGVAVDFPTRGIHVVNDAVVYHHMEQFNRLEKPLQYYRRVLALHYFIKTKKKLSHVKKRWLLWSLVGNMLKFTFAGNGKMIRVSFKIIRMILFGRNPYYKASKKGEKLIEPIL